MKWLPDTAGFSRVRSEVTTFFGEAARLLSRRSAWLLFFQFSERLDMKEKNFVLKMRRCLNIL
jgi:hypothetical protein